MRHMVEGGFVAGLGRFLLRWRGMAESLGPQGSDPAKQAERQKATRILATCIVALKERPPVDQHQGHPH